MFQNGSCLYIFFLSSYRVCVCACVRARACVRSCACVRACVRVFVRVLSLSWCHNIMYIYNILPRFCFLLREYANEEAALFVRIERVRDDDIVAGLEQHPSRDLTKVRRRGNVGATDEGTRSIVVSVQQLPGTVTNLRRCNKYIPGTYLYCEQHGVGVWWQTETNSRCRVFGR